MTADELQSAFIAGLDKAREHYTAYGEWPTLFGRVEMAQDAYPDEPEEPKPASALTECSACDGCGWYEGGEALQTTCQVCKGTGAIPAISPEPSA